MEQEKQSIVRRFRALGIAAAVLVVVAGGMLVAWLVEARNTARILHAEVQLRTIGVAVLNYASHHGDHLPASSDQLVTAQYVKDSILVNPRRDHGLTGRFVYRRPAPKLSDAESLAGSVMAWEGFDTFPRGGIFVLYGDLHSERVMNEAGFRASVGE